jgi:hypothetical protein
MAFQYHPLLLPGKDTMPHRNVSWDVARIETFGRHEAVCVEWESLGRLTKQAMRGMRAKLFTLDR